MTVGDAAPRYLPAGESALVVEFGRTIDARSHARVLALDAALAAAAIEGIRETVPTYRSLMVHFDPRRWSTAALVTTIAALDVADGPHARPASWRLPACYEAPHAEDLAEVADRLGLTLDRVVALHAQATYTVVMYGFAPGFVFLGGVPEALTLSRRTTPRPPAPPGALTIAAGQALIASVSMPTGWYVLGRTPFRPFDPDRTPVFPLAVGDIVRFDPIDAGQFAALKADPAAVFQRED